MTEAEKRLLAMQQKFAREHEPAKKAQIRREYIEAHRKWVASKSQLPLGRSM